MYLFKTISLVICTYYFSINAFLLHLVPLYIFTNQVLTIFDHILQLWHLGTLNDSIQFLKVKTLGKDTIG